MENKTAVLLLSGGIDSTTLLAKLSNEGYTVVALSFNYGQKHSIELEYAKSNALKYRVKLHKTIEIDSQIFETSALVNKATPVDIYTNTILPKGKVNAYVPFRNLVFTSIALSFAESLSINEVHFAFNKDDSNNFWDCKKDFVQYINAIAGLSTSIKICTPFIELSKKEIINLAQKLNVNIEETITCYQPIGKTECGQCLSCRSKHNALTGN